MHHPQRARPSSPATTPMSAQSTITGDDTAPSPVRDFGVVHDVASRGFDQEAEVYAHAEQTLGGIRTVQAFGREGYEIDRFARRAI